MKQVTGLKNMKAISRGAFLEALQGKYVALVGLIHIPYDDNDFDDNNLDETVAIRLRTLEGQIEECRQKKYQYINAGLFRKPLRGTRGVTATTTG